MALVVIQPYAKEWPTLYRILHDELIYAFAPISIKVEHIGSTAVPGLSAKPVIDIVLGATTLAEIETKIKPLSELGYEYVSKYEKEIPERRYFVKSSANSIRVHLHAVVLNSKIWQKHIAFRDALRNDPYLCSQYQSLKLQLAEQFIKNKSAYTSAKSPFIESVLARYLNAMSVFRYEE